MQPAKDGGLNASINVTPLVDVVLVLLIIFMVIAPQLHLNEEIELPQTQGPPDKPETESQIVVSIDAEGALRVNDTPVTRETLPEQLARDASAIEEPKIVIKGDARLSFGHVQKTMFEIEAAGFGNVGLIARRSEG